MYCDEPILAVYYGMWDVYMDEFLSRDSECFFDHYHEIAYHTTDGQIYLFETETYMIIIGAFGVKKEPKTKEPFRITDYEIFPLLEQREDGSDWVYPEVTMFVGEKLLAAAEKEGFWLLTFDDFEMKVIPYELGKLEKWLDRIKTGSYVPVLGCDRHIKRNCAAEVQAKFSWTLQMIMWFDVKSAKNPHGQV